MNEKAQALRAQIDDRIRTLATATDEAARSEILRTWLISCAKFYNYSIGNLWLIALQSPNATRVAGFNAWKKHNRYVRKGEHGIAILAPCVYKPRKDTPEDKNDPQRDGKPHGFRVVYVFDLAQTEGDPLPEPPAWSNPAQDFELQSRLMEYARSRGLEVLESDAGLHGAEGCTDGKVIQLRPGTGTSTLIHELAHCLLQHTGRDRLPLTRETRELEAEATAYIVATHFGLPNLASPNYLAIWDADSKAINARMDRIRKCAADIITAIEPAALELAEE